MDRFTLITGASSGLGAEFARIAARNKRNVILTARSQEALEALAEEVRQAHGIHAVTLPGDLGAAGEPARIWGAAAEGRQIDLLVNNAGLGANGPFEDTDWAREQQSIDVNVTGLTALCKHAAPHMKAQRAGRILNVASTAAFVPGPNMAVYHATKAYVLSFSVALAEELTGTGVTVTTLCPGATQTGFFEAAEMTALKIVRSGGLPTAKSVAEFGYGAAIGGRLVAVPGTMNKASAMMGRLLPLRASARLVKRVMA
ncbi:MAG: SDR family oxidoreductase [Pseudomonadota bacterium]